ncbi:zinc-ribbon domain-containing protein, partial [Streptococcus pyogenes]
SIAMRGFHCSHCGQLVFFDSVQCVHCGSTLAFLPDRLEIAALDGGDSNNGIWSRIPASHDASSPGASPSALSHDLSSNS